MIYIGIDISKISTAVCIERNSKIELYNYTTHKPNNIWISDTSDFINYRFINYDYLNEKDYSKKEMKKFDEFEIVSDLILNDILDNIRLLETIIIGIEGFSFNSNSGPIIDLVELSTLIKHKLKTKIQGIKEIRILSPLTIKTRACEMVYGETIIQQGKRKIKYVKVIQNPAGKLGKNFDKKDMFQTYIDSDIDMDFKNHLKDNREAFLKNKELPKPIDDVIDSIFIKEIIKRFNE